VTWAVTGPVGASGPTGARGKVGAQGPAGADGPQGLEGAAGPTGPQGEAGPSGPRGITGTNGEQGVPGPVGPLGPQGLIGLTGLQGLMGPTGPAGPAGERGQKGDAGTQGVAGTSAYDRAVSGGYIGSSSDWLASLIGPQGPQGAQGPAGAIGPQGSQGPAGSEGPQGPQGPQGPEGLEGAAGSVGAAGPSGPPGVAGPIGPTGPPGAFEVQTVAGESVGDFVSFIDNRQAFISIGGAIWRINLQSGVITDTGLPNQTPYYYTSTDCSGTMYNFISTDSAWPGSTTVQGNVAKVSPVVSGDIQSRNNGTGSPCSSARTWYGTGTARTIALEKVVTPATVGPSMVLAKVD
jgi:hypothetical protein